MAELTPQQKLSKVQQHLGHVVFDFKEEAWLDTGIRELNEVFGDPDRGIPYGRIIEISGLESVGKSALCFTIAALAQADDAQIIWLDFENSFTAKWAALRGLDVEKMAVISPYVGSFSSKNEKGRVVQEKEPRMPNAEELCSQAETLVKMLSKKGGKMVLVIDSMPAMIPKDKANTAFEDQNFKTDQALPKFLSKLFSKWVGMAQAHNVLILAINQLRQNPMQRFGDPWFTPGGNAMRFYGHIRVRVYRAKGGKIVQTSKKGKLQIGIQGIVRNFKNKAGGLEQSKVAYKLFFSGTTKFLPAEELEGADDDD